MIVIIDHNLKLYYQLEYDYLLKYLIHQVFQSRILTFFLVNFDYFSSCLLVYLFILIFSSRIFLSIKTVHAEL